MIGYDNQLYQIDFIWIFYHFLMYIVQFIPHVRQGMVYNIHSIPWWWSAKGLGPISLTTVTSQFKCDWNFILFLFKILRNRYILHLNKFSIEFELWWNNVNEMGQGICIYAIGLFVSEFPSFNSRSFNTIFCWKRNTKPYGIGKLIAVHHQISLCNFFLHHGPWISPWIKSISKMLDINFTYLR